jgi:D-glycero-D-manno-heptose 1,7-bisphosphate phosphatase
MNRAVFLDRDGTINSMVYYPDFGIIDSPATPDEFQLIPGVRNAIRAINQAGLLCVVVSNQPGVAKGRFTLQLLEAVTQKMHASLTEENAFLNAVYYCLHHPDGSIAEFRSTCNCRKPKPGLLLNAAEDLAIDLQNSYIVGDGITDILAGNSVGATTFLIGSKKCTLCEELDKRQAKCDYFVADLHEAVNIILSIEANGNQKIY